MDVDNAKKLLTDNGYAIEGVVRLGNDSGTQIRIAGGAVVNVYDKGTYLPQGGNPELKKAVKEILDNAEASPKSLASNEIFVVYGHDRNARNELELMLRRWRLEPLLLDQLPSGGDTIIEKLAKYTAKSGYAIVLATPDDEGNLRGKSDKKSLRARQNVVLELGMVLAKLGRERVAILVQEPPQMEPPSDISGLVYIPFKDDVAEAESNLRRELVNAGYSIP